MDKLRIWVYFVVWKESCSRAVELSANLCHSAATHARLDVWAAGSFCLSSSLTLKVRRAKFAAYPSRVLKHSRFGTIPHCHKQSISKRFEEIRKARDPHHSGTLRDEVPQLFRILEQTSTNRATCVKNQQF